MKIKYDKKVDALYISFAKGEYSKSRKVTETILVDEDIKGKVLGVEILDASKNILKFNPKKTNFQMLSA